MKKSVLMVAAAGMLASQAWAGYQLTMKTVAENDSRGSRGHGGQDGNSTLVMTTDAGKARIDFKEGHGPGPAKGGYLITTDAGKTFTMVSPEEKTYMKWDTEAMLGMAGAMGNMMKMQISDPKVETILDEAGETILGYPTRHYQFRTSYHMSMAVMGFKSESTVSRDEDMWTTTKLDAAVLGEWVNRMPKTQNREMDKLIKAQQSKMTGIPLRIHSMQTTTDNQGKTSVSKTSMDVTEIKKVGAGDVSFEIPADYQEMNLFQPPAEQGSDNADEAKPAARKTAPKIDFGSLMKRAMESAK